MNSDKYILDKTESALNLLDEALSKIIDSSDEKYQIGKLGRAIGMIREFQSPIYEQNPDLRPPSPWNEMEVPTLSDDELREVGKISEAKLKEIDQELLSLVTEQPQKVAKIVLTYLFKNKDSLPGISDVFYAQRIERLASEGKIEYAGNLKFMQYCEVRIPKT